VMSHPGVAI